MPLLVDFTKDAGTARPASAAETSMPLLAPADWQPGSGNGLLLATDDEPEERFVNAPLIAIEFPTFHDGRGLSLAVLLRTRLGYQGEMRAQGDIQPDLLHYLRRCGFDNALIADGRHNSLDQAVLQPYSRYYQASVIDPVPAFRRQRG